MAVSEVVGERSRSRRSSGPARVPLSSRAARLRPAMPVRPPVISLAHRRGRAGCGGSSRRESPATPSRALGQGRPKTPEPVAPYGTRHPYGPGAPDTRVPHIPDRRAGPAPPRGPDGLAGAGAPPHG